MATARVGEEAKLTEAVLLVAPSPSLVVTTKVRFCSVASTVTRIARSTDCAIEGVTEVLVNCTTKVDAEPPECVPMMLQVVPLFLSTLPALLRIAPSTAAVSGLMLSTSPVMAPATVILPPLKLAESLSVRDAFGASNVVVDALTAMGLKAATTGASFIGSTVNVVVAVFVFAIESTMDHSMVREFEREVGDVLFV